MMESGGLQYSSSASEWCVISRAMAGHCAHGVLLSDATNSSLPGLTSVRKSGVVLMVQATNLSHYNIVVLLYIRFFRHTYSSQGFFGI